MSKPISEMGWDELVPGAALYTFDGDIDYNIADIQPEDRMYSETSSKGMSVGDWRVIKPVWNSETCIDCQNCWIFCPDTSIIARNKEMKGVDYEHCKGCGLCVSVCPTNPKSLLMFNEYISTEDALSQWPAKKKKGEE